MWWPPHESSAVGSTTVRVVCNVAAGCSSRAPNHLPLTVGGGSGIEHLPVSCTGALAYGSAQDMPTSFDVFAEIPTTVTFVRCC